MKARRSRRASEVIDSSAVLQELEASRDTQDLEQEVTMLEMLGLEPSLSFWVPRLYGLASRDGPDFKFSAYFMEDCEGYYPLGIADTIKPALRNNLSAWLEVLHHKHIVHRNLSGENILFNSSKPGSFYVTGWGRSLTMSLSDGTAIPNWDNQVAHDIESLHTLFIRKEPNSVPPEKRARYNDDVVDGESRN
ncbi:hypothetical protein BDZ89DRAFT_360873 [Hymenopellis radicata]|nr:hypothetical protein BDZ89DRAFT_360873 [Hymenopellis radicata]